MYKVFVNDAPIILTSSLKKENNYPIYIYKDTVIDEIIYKLKYGNLKGINLYCADIKKTLSSFYSYFKVEIAAGGLVFNKKNECLFIYRINKWELPKGHIEKGEDLEATAIREVEEECGVTNLKIDKFLLTTRHIFIQKKVYKLKEIHWFLMYTDFNGVLTPQIEEGITKVEFKDEKSTKIVLKSTYQNIILVYKEYLKSIS